MKIVLFACNSFVSNEEIVATIATLGENIKIHVLDQRDLFGNFTETRNSQNSKFIISVKKIIEVCGDPTEQEAFRGKFYKLAYTKVIDRVLLEIVSTGPKNLEEKKILKEMHCEFLPMIATAALTQLINEE